MLIIYHKNDLDGICSGAILHNRFPSAELMGYHYGEPFDMGCFQDGETVIMADVSLPMEKMEEIAIKSGNFTWIDHHVSAHEDFKGHFPGCSVQEDGSFSALDGNFKYIYEDGRAACELCWEYVSDKPVPDSILLLGRYDTWRQGEGDWKNETLPFQWGMRVHGFTPETLEKYLFDIVPLHMHDKLIVGTEVKVGHRILKYQSNQNEFAMKQSFDARIGGIRAIVCCGVPFNSTSFDSVWDEDKYDVMCPINFNGKEWAVSFYTTKDHVDCSVLAKKFGGGGHRKAAGCKVADLRDLMEY